MSSVADQDDLDVDKIITRLESALSDLKAAQRKDEADEDSEESPESQPKTLTAASQKARQVFAAKRREQAKQ